MKLRKKVSKFISYALVMMMTMSLLATPALADNAKVTYIVHHMYPNSTDINNSYQGRDDINNFFTEYDGTYAGNTLEEGYQTPSYTISSNEIFQPQPNDTMKSAWENAHPGFTLTPENKTIKKSVQQDTTEQVYLYYFSSAIPSNNSLMTVQHTFIGKGGASFPVNGQMVSSTIKLEYKMGTTGSKCTPDYHELASALEEAGYTVTKPDKIEATYGTNAKVTYNYEVAPPSSQPQEPKITYTVKHMYAKTISVNATTNPDDFYEYDGTYGGKTIEEGYTNEKVNVKNGESYTGTANQKLIEAFEAANAGYTLNPIISNVTVNGITADQEKDYTIYYIVQEKSKGYVYVTHTFQSNTPFMAGNQQAYGIQRVEMISGYIGSTATAEYDTVYLPEFEKILSVKKPAKKTVTFGTDTAIEYVYQMTSKNGGNSQGGGNGSSTTTTTTTTDIQNITTTMTGSNLVISNMSAAQAQTINQTIAAGSSVAVNSGSIKFTIAKEDSSSVSILQVSGSGAVTIPDTITVGSQTYAVSSVGGGAFANNQGISQVTFGKNVTTVEDGAFENCKNLKKVIFNEGLTSIGNNAFKGCSSLEEVVMPSTLTSIGESAFEGCSNLKRLVLNNGLLNIGKKAFKNCISLPSVKIPSSLLDMEDSCFENCKKLATVQFASSPQLLAIRSAAFKGCVALKSISIPKSVEELGNKAFYGCTKLSKVTGMAGIITIGNQTFMNCKALKSFTIAKNVQEIGKKAFYGCKKLGKIKVSSKFLQTVKSSAFKKIKKNAKFTLPKGKKDSYQKLLRKNCDKTAKL